MWGVAVLVVLLLVAAAVHDWRARRTGHDVRATRAYWDGVQAARRQARHDRAASLLTRRVGSPRPPKKP
jgi:hypothetical protein